MSGGVRLYIGSCPSLQSYCLKMFKNIEYSVGSESPSTVPCSLLTV